MVAWKQHPFIKVEADSTEIQSDSLTVIVHRPENAISRVILSASDVKGRHYVANLDVFDTLKVSFRHGAGSWTQVFEGIIEQVGPKRGVQQTADLPAQ